MSAVISPIDDAFVSSAPRVVASPSTQMRIGVEEEMVWPVGITNDHTPEPFEVVVWRLVVVVPIAILIFFPVVIVVTPSSLYRVPESVRVAASATVVPKRRKNNVARKPTTTGTEN